MKKAIRRIFTALPSVLALALALSLSACGSGNSDGNVSGNGSGKDDAAPKSLYAQGLEVVQLMNEMTRTEEYAGFYTSDGAIHGIIREIGAGDYTAPKAVYAISVPDDSLAAMVGLDQLDGASEELKDFLMQKTLGSLMTQINAKSGVENLAASSMCTAGKTFVHESAEDGIYLYTYENALPVAVTFTVGEEQAVSAGGVFILHDGFPYDSADEIQSYFREILAVAVDVKEVPPEK